MDEKPSKEFFGNYGNSTKTINKERKEWKRDLKWKIKNEAKKSIFKKRVE